MFIVPGEVVWPRTAQRVILQELPEEILDHILRWIAFRGLRMLLHSGSSVLARLARDRLGVLKTAVQMRPNATDPTTFNPFRPRIPPRPTIEEVGKMLLGKELVLVGTQWRDEFVS